MSDINRINISLLKNYKSSFNSAQSKFVNTSYNTFNSSYLKQCSDPYILNMSSKLNGLYKKIEKSYGNINKWWSDYNSNVENLENYLSGNGQVGAITESCVRNYVISNLPKLEDYDVAAKELNIALENFNNFALNDIQSLNPRLFSKLLSYLAMAKPFLSVTASSTIGPVGYILSIILSYILGDHLDDLTDTFIESLYMFVSGDLKGAVINILDELWVVDTASTTTVGFSSILAGTQKFGIGLITDLMNGYKGPIPENLLPSFKEISSLNEKINSKEEYILTDDEASLLVEYYYYNEEINIDDSNLQALIKYFEEKSTNNNVVEYQEILSVLNSMKDSGLSPVSQKAKLSTILRLLVQSDVDVIKNKFYAENNIGDYINKNSYIKFDSKLAQGLEEGTETVSIYGAHIAYNGFVGFWSALIPFGDSVFKPSKYKEGFYFSDELGEDKFNKVANASYIGGSATGIVTGIGIDVGLGLLTGGSYTVVSTTAKAANVIDKTSDVLRAVDKVSDFTNAIDKISDTAKVIDKAEDAISALDKIGDSVKALDKAADVAKGVDKASDTLSAIDKISDTAKNIDKAIDSIKNIDKFNFVRKAIDKATDALKSLEKGADSVKAFDDIADAIKLFDKASDAFKSSSKLAKSLDKLVKLQNVTNILDNITDTLGGIDKATDIGKITKKLTNFSKLFDRFTKTIKTVDAVDNVGDALNYVDDIGKVSDNVDDYIFKIDYDAIPIENRAQYKEIVDNMTSSIKMDKNLGEALEAIYDTDDYIIGIHKSGISNPDDIVKDGLRLTGDSSSGVAFNGIDLNNNIVFENPSGADDIDFLRFCKNIEGSAGYKTVTGEGNAIIIKIPKADFDDISKLTFFDGNQYVLKNDYIAGYVKTHMDDAGNVIFENIIYKNNVMDGIVNPSNSINKFDNVSEVLSNFKQKFNDGQSDSKLLNLISEQFENAIKEGNEDALVVLNKLLDLKQSNPKLKFKLVTPSKDKAVSFYSKATDSINIMPVDLKSESLTNFHELFHMIDYEHSYKYNKYIAPNNYEEVFDSARVKLSKNNNEFLNEFVDKYRNRWKSQRKEANNLFSKKIGQAGFNDFDSYRQYLINQYDNVLKSSSVDGIKKYIDDLGIEQYIMSGKVDGATLADADIASSLNSLRREAYNKFENSWGNVSDIIDAVLKGKIKDDYNLSGHGVQYYSRTFSDFKETIANFGALKVGAPERLDDVKHFLGEDFYEFIENAYNLRVGKKVSL